MLPKNDDKKESTDSYILNQKRLPTWKRFWKDHKEKYIELEPELPSTPLDGAPPPPIPKGTMK